MRRIEQQETNRPEQGDDDVAHRLPTARAVFQPRSSTVPSGNREPQSVTSPIADHEPDDLIDPLIPGHMSGYRISLFAVGREELAEVLPEQRETIEQLTDLQVEELAMQIEEALTEIYKMTLRAVLMSYMANPLLHR